MGSQDTSATPRSPNLGHQTHGRSGHLGHTSVTKHTGSQDTSATPRSPNTREVRTPRPRFGRQTHEKSRHTGHALVISVTKHTGVQRWSCPRCPMVAVSEVSDGGGVRGVRRWRCPRCPTSVTPHIGHLGHAWLRLRNTKQTLSAGHLGSTASCGEPNIPRHRRTFFFCSTD